MLSPNRGIRVAVPQRPDWPYFAPAKGWLTDPRQTCAISASQIATWNDCRRKWGFEKIEGIRHSSAAVELGLAVHGILEAAQAGTPIDQTTKAGLIASAHIADMPDEALTEFDITVWLRDRVLDLSNPVAPKTIDGGCVLVGRVDRMWFDQDVIVIDDHKTTSDFKWAKTEDELLRDPQFLSYATWVIQQFGVDRVRGRWLYYHTRKPPKGKIVSVTASADTVLDGFVKYVLSPGLYIEQVRRSLNDIKHLPVNQAACGKYGGCKHAAYCDGNSAFAGL